MANKNIKVYTTAQVDKLVEGLSVKPEIMSFTLETSSDGSASKYYDNIYIDMGKHTFLALYITSGTSYSGDKLYLQDYNTSTNVATLRTKDGDKLLFFGNSDPDCVCTNVNGDVVRKSLRDPCLLLESNRSTNIQFIGVLI